MISTMENGGGLIETNTPSNSQDTIPPPDEWLCRDCPWKHPETCKVCKEEKHGKND